MIDAHTKVCGLIAWPIGHSLSPMLHNMLNEIMHVNSVYIPFPVKSDLKSTIAGLHAAGVIGLNITIPYKQDVILYLSGLSEQARMIGAVNTLSRDPDTDKGYNGCNTDILGLGKAIEHSDIDITKKPALLIGAGGAAKAAAFLCADMGVSSLTIVNRDEMRGKKLSEEILKYYPDLEICCGGLDEAENLCRDDTVAIQATSLGMYPDTDSVAIESEGFYERCSAGIDIVYTPERTAFLDKMIRLGKKTLGGLDMFINQAVASWEIWNPNMTVQEDTIRKMHEVLSRELKNR